MRLLLLLVVALAAVASSNKVSYDGYQVLRTQTLNATATRVLRKLQLENNDLDFWREANPGMSADIMASPQYMPTLKKFLNDMRIPFSVMIEDFGRLSRENEKSMAKSGSAFDWTSYHSHKDMNSFIDGLSSANSDFVSTVSIGQSYEGRDMRVIQITKAGANKPNVWIEAGIHAREWIASAVGTYLINELVTNYAQHKDIVDNLNFHFLPMANPDGYEYTRSNNRGWRKTRSDNPGSGCKGTDPNRNWAFKWGENGVSHDPCSDVYLGSKPFSEVETRNIRDYVNNLSPVPLLGHCIHSYSQLWLWPYGYAYDAYPENWQEIKQLAEDAADALYQVHGTYFTPMNSAELYPAAGASDDWYRGTLGARFSFTTELRDTGHYGFELPANQIIPSGEEMWAGMEVVFKKLIELSKSEQGN